MYPFDSISAVSYTHLSFSYDVMIIALSGYFSAVCLDLAYKAERVEVRDVAVLALVMAVKMCIRDSNGAAGCYLLLMIGLVIGFGLYTAGAYQSEKKENAGNGGSNT